MAAASTECVLVTYRPSAFTTALAFSMRGTLELAGMHKERQAAFENKPWVAQGIRFGIAVALLGVVPTYMIYYVVQPFPGDLVVKQIVFEGILIVILGAVVAFFYKQPSSA